MQVRSEIVQFSLYGLPLRTAQMPGDRLQVCDPKRTCVMRAGKAQSA